MCFARRVVGGVQGESFLLSRPSRAYTHTQRYRGSLASVVSVVVSSNSSLGGLRTAVYMYIYARGVRTIRGSVRVAAIDLAFCLMPPQKGGILVSQAEQETPSLVCMRPNSRPVGPLGGYF